MDIATRNNILELLPSELIAKILAMLDYRDLASCTQVCKRVFDLIGSSSSLQYHLELGRACMVDGPPGGMSTAERRERLHAHVDARRNLRWSSCVQLFDLHDTVMKVAPGGILSFMSYSQIKFVLPPSNIRGISMRQWEYAFPFALHDVALDPSEDILVVSQRGLFRFHFLSLSTGGPHPLAANFTFPDPPPSIDQFQVIVSGSYVAALIPKHQVIICDWKSGQTVLRIKSTGAQSVTFLPENRLLLASTNTSGLTQESIPDGIADGPVLALYNLDPVPVSGRQRGRLLPVAIFAVELGRDIVPFEMRLHYRLDIHSYPSEVAVPFFASPADHIVALETKNQLKPLDSPRVILPAPHVLLIPIARLLHHVGTTENGQTRYILWDDWGSTGTRRAPAIWPTNCSNSASGSRFIPCPESVNVIGVLDFSRASVAQLQTSVPESVPCVQKEVAVPGHILGRATAAISEDVFVIRESPITSPEERVYLLVF